ncbi:hypothetical protein D3C73_695370 [compost metagenome]
MFEVPETEIQHQRTGGVAHGKTDVLEQQVIEFSERLILVFTAGEGHFLEHERMAANRALAEDHQVARENVRAFDGDENRRAVPFATEVVVRPHDDRLAAVHIHGIADAVAAALGQVVLENRRQHRRFLAQIDRIGGQHAGGVHHPGVAANAGHGFLDAFERGNRHIELLANLSVLARYQTGELGHAGAHRRQGNRTPDRQAVHQHHPAFAEHLLAADEELQRDEHVLARVRAIHECRAQRQMPAADLDTGDVGRNQCQADAQVFLVTQQVIRIVGLEGQAEEGGHRTEGDVAFFPVQAQAEDFLALPFTFADHSRVRHAAGVGAGQRTGQGKARDVVAARQARQVVIALFVGAVMQQQFGRAEGIGDHHG